MPGKGKTKQRGYGNRHKELRKAWKRKVEAGTETCRRCGMTIDPWEPWDLDHADDRVGYLGPSHRYCNRSRSQMHRPSRVW